MPLVLDISTSAEFWRQRYPVDRAPSMAAIEAPHLCAQSQKEVWNLAPFWIDAEFLSPLDGVLHVLSFQHADKRKSRTHTVHTWSGPVPKGSFYELNDEVFVMSPCFMFLMAANILPVHKLIAFGDELCGLYSFDQREERGFRKRSVPLISKEQLTEYLKQAEGCNGRKQSMIALRHVVNRSASPMETFDEMLLCLPYRLGGYGLRVPTMNAEVHLSIRAAHVAQRKTCFLDMGYFKPKIDIEHHGRLDHSTLEEVMNDRARVNGLKEMGFEVIELTYPQVEDLLTFEIVAERIAKLLGKRIDKSKCGATSERLELRADVLAWNRSSGRIR